MVCCYLVKLELIELQESQKDEYNHFVATQESGSFLQSWEWGQWQEALGRQVFRYKVLDDSGAQVALIQLIKSPLPFGKYYLYAPYGPVLAKSEQYQVLGIMNQALQRQFPRAVFIRVEPKFPLPANGYPLLVKSSNIQPGKTLLVDLTKSEGELLAEMHHKTRYNIRLAEKHGVKIKDEFDISIGNGLFAKEAVNLIVETSKRQGYKGYGKDYYERMIDCLAIHPFLSSRPSPNASEGAWRDPSSQDGTLVKGFPARPAGGLGSDELTRNDKTLKLHIYKAIYNNQLLSSAIMIDFPAKGGSAFGGGTRTFLFGGSSESHKNVMAPYLMHWQAMQDAKSAGLETYDFWGTETSKGTTPGFVRFKLGFGGLEKQYMGAFDIILEAFSYKIYKIIRNIKRFL